MGEVDPSTALKPRSEEWGKKTRPSISLGAVRLSNGSGSTLSMPSAEARGSRRVDTERGEGYKLARHGILLPSGDSDSLQALPPL